MAAIRTAAFSFRDFLEAILPTLIAVLLFIPYVSSSNSIDIAFVIVALFGYAISSPINSIAKFLFRKIFFLKKLLKHINEENEWWSKNFNYNKLFYIVSSDEREYMYLTSAYASCFRSMVLYFFAYAVMQIFFLSQAIMADYHNWSNILLAVKTPMFGGWEIPSLVALIAAIIVTNSLIKEFLKELNFLFDGEVGQYVIFAKKYQQSTGDIAKSVWGTVFHENKKVSNLKIFLEVKGIIVDSCFTDNKGRFQFINKYSELKNKKCDIKLFYKDQNYLFELNLSSNIVPEYIIKI